MYNYRVYWTNEHGKSEESFHETKSERDAKLEYLADQNFDAGWQNTDPQSDAGPDKQEQETA